MELAKCELVEYRQRLLCNRPPASYDYLQITLPSSMDTVQRYEQLIQQTKTRLVAVYLAGIEARIDQYQTRLREQTKQMWQQHRQHVPDREMSPVLAELIDKRASISEEETEQGSISLRSIMMFEVRTDTKKASARARRRICVVLVFSHHLSLTHASMPNICSARNNDNCYNVGPPMFRPVNCTCQCRCPLLTI